MSTLAFTDDMAGVQRALAQCHDMVVRRSAVLEALRLRSGERALEIGCGGGFYAYEAAPPRAAQACGRVLRGQSFQDVERLKNAFESRCDARLRTGAHEATQRREETRGEKKNEKRAPCLRTKRECPQTRSEKINEFELVAPTGYPHRWTLAASSSRAKQLGSLGSTHSTFG